MKLGVPGRVAIELRVAALAAQASLRRLDVAGSPGVMPDIADALPPGVTVLVV